MIRYFFDIRDGAELYPDEEGLELANEGPLRWRLQILWLPC
ncbi:hypothetical protein [Bradyrhizobium sp. CCGUVB23]